jgi:hypothetical protein
MWACFFRDQAVEDVSTEWLTKHEPALRKHCLAYHRQHGFPPHPGVLVRDVLKAFLQEVLGTLHLAVAMKCFRNDSAVKPTLQKVWLWRSNGMLSK